MTLAVKEMMGRSRHNNYLSLVSVNTKCVRKKLATYTEYNSAVRTLAPPPTLVISI